MNPQSNIMSDSPLQSQMIATAPAPIPALHQMYWLVRRELWEYRSLYIAPLAVAAVMMFGFLISTIHRPGLRGLDPAMAQEVIARPYNFAALLIMGVSLIVGIAYCLGALQNERGDRSILFWKSLPVSDLTTVLSKASIPFLVLPLIAFAVTIATQITMLLLNTLTRLASGRSPVELWTQLPGLSMSGMLLYHLIAVHSLWWAPLWGWLLLVSAWARRAAFLWATVPLIAIGILEKIVFDNSGFASFLQYRLFGSPESGSASGDGMALMSPSPASLLTSPGFWIGLLFAAACLAGAVRLRRYREPI
jgi:ABC-2 type transport system permease protein